MKKSLIESAFGMMLPAGAATLNPLSMMNFAGAGAPLMKHVMAGKHIAKPTELLGELVKGGAQIIACQMSS